MSTHSLYSVRCRGIIVHEGRLLVVSHPGNSDYVVLPGGHLDPGEDIEACMRRELKEELGVKSEIGPLLYVHTFTDRRGQQSVDFFFRILNSGDFLDSTNRDRTHAHELESVEWVTIEDTRTFLPAAVWHDFVTDQLDRNEVRFIS